MENKREHEERLYSRRDLVEQLMPSILRLRVQGFSFKQITKLLNQAVGKAGPKFQPHILIAYYNELLTKRIEEVGVRLIDEYVQVFEKIRDLDETLIDKPGGLNWLV